MPARASGSDLLTSVAAQSLAVPCGALGGRLPWLRAPGAIALAAGLGLYAAMIARFEAPDLVRGGGDQWVAGGALAIACLACAQLTPDAPAVTPLWIAALAWTPHARRRRARTSEGGRPRRPLVDSAPTGDVRACTFPSPARSP